jgi:hypothetical protein
MCPILGHANCVLVEVKAEICVFIVVKIWNLLFWIYDTV